MIRYLFSNKTNVTNFISLLTPDVDVAMDTETTGLHITLAKPVVLSICIKNQKDEYTSGAIKINEKSLDSVKLLVHALCEHAKNIVFYNAKFDIHMLTNIGIDLEKYKDKITDAAFYARACEPAVSNKDGGSKLSLKDLAQKYSKGDAKRYQKAVAFEKTKIVKLRTQKLRSLGYNTKQINEFQRNKLIEVPQDALSILTDPKYNENNYSNIPEDVLLEYAIYDAYFTIKLFHMYLPLTFDKNQNKIVQRENACVFPLVKMERAGLKINRKYLLESKEKLKNYILEKREQLKELVGCELTVGQHKKIKEVLQTTWNVYLQSTDKKNLIALQGHSNPQVALLASIITELRRLEKWYATYICRWLEHSENLEYIYTSYNQVGAVSGRFSSDFQQFPSAPIISTITNEELFTPRKMVIPREGHKLVSLDFNSQELRIQAIYTILCGHPDKTLCSAFVPYQQDPNTWTPTDPHTALTLKAFKDIKVTDPKFPKYRKIGKCTNFACNYGASAKTLRETYGYSEELANTLYNAYRETYPGVIEYKRYVNDILHRQNYITNLFGRRYYDVSAHKAANYLIQGSAADYLKIVLPKIDKLLTGTSTRMVLQVHDEIVFETPINDDSIIPEIVKIMESFGNGKSPIPLTVSREESKTNWAEKADYENDNEIEE